MRGLSGAAATVRDYMWAIDSDPEAVSTGGYDGAWWKWPLRRDDESSFTVVKIPAHAEFSEGDRIRRAVESRGRTEVERHLDADIPPRVLELRSTDPAPAVVARG